MVVAFFVLVADFVVVVVVFVVGVVDSKAVFVVSNVFSLG